MLLTVGADGTAGDEVTFPGAGGAGGEVAGVGGGGEVEGAVGGDVVDGLGDGAILEGAFVEVGDVVDDDVAVVGEAQGADVGGEAGDAVEGGGEDEVGAGCHVVDDLHHGGAFVGAGAGLAGNDGDVGREVAGGDEGGDAGGRGGVGQDADGYAGAVDAHGDDFVGGVADVALGGDGTDVGGGEVGFVDALDVGVGGEGAELGEADAGAEVAGPEGVLGDVAVGVEDAGHGGAGHEGGREVGVDVDEQLALGVEDAGFVGEAGEVAEGNVAGFTGEQDEVRGHLLLGGGEGVFEGEDLGDLFAGGGTELRGRGDGSEGDGREEGYSKRSVAKEVPGLYRDERHSASPEIVELAMRISGFGLPSRTFGAKGFQ